MYDFADSNRNMKPMDKFFSRIGIVALIVLAVVAMRYTVSGTDMASVFSSSSSSKTAEVNPADNVAVTSLSDLNNALADIAEKTSPTVVTVSTKKTVRVNTGVNMFDFFFGNPNPRQNQREFTQEGLGSGVIVSTDGFILTNHHVVANSDTIYVTTNDNRQLAATLIGSDPATDIAVIKVLDASNLTAISLGNSDNVRVGEMVMAIGSPLATNLATTVTMGIISGKGRYNLSQPQSQDGGPTYEDFIQTDAAINPGNSGGALVNLNGELIGINSAIVTRSGGFQGIGLAIPSNMARRVMDDLISEGRVIRAYLGVFPQDIDPNLAKALNLQGTEGVLIANVEPETPAAKGGLESGDVVTEINGEKVPNASRFRLKLGAMKPGDKAALKVIRDGRERNLSVTLAEFPNEVAAVTTDSDAGKSSINFGFRVSALDEQTARRMNVNPATKGVVVANVDPNSEAYANGLRDNDIIVSVDRTATPDVDRFNAVMGRKTKGTVALLQIVRGNFSMYMAFEV
jgi:serine protease Do